MFRVAIIGPESTGKSTLAAYLARRYNGLLIPEYARTYVEQLNRPYTYDDVVAIARYQIEEIESIFHQRSSQYTNSKAVFFDTDLIITKVWFEYKYGSCPDWLLKALHDYPMDVYLLTYPDIDWKPDPVRENPNIRLELFNRYKQEIQTLNIPYYIIKHRP